MNTNASYGSSRRTFLKTAGGAGMAILSQSMTHNAFAEEAAVDPRVAKIVMGTISVDMHNHAPQPAFAKSSADAPPDAIIDLKGAMKSAGLSAVCFTYAEDAYRSPKPGEWYQFHLQTLAALDRILEQNHVRRALTMADLKAAHRTNTPIVIQDCEGAQWIEGHLERVEEAYKRGLRHMQLVHQMHALVSPLADVQQLIQSPDADPNTKPVEVTGLTAFGADVIRECNRLGIVVDMAHATEAAVVSAVKVSQKPIVVTHTALDTPISRTDKQYTGNPGLAARLVSRNYVKAVADAGGVIGVWHIFLTLRDFVTGLKQMADVAGVDHTGIGTDTSIAPPTGSRGGGTNAIWPDQRAGFLYAVVAEMLAQGFHAGEISKIIGGNYCRVFQQVTQGHM